MTARLRIAGLASATPAIAAPFSFDNGNVDGRFASASRPSGPGAFEIESADDFLLANHTLIGGATFIGLLPANASLASIGDVTVETRRALAVRAFTRTASGANSSTTLPLQAPSLGCSAAMVLTCAR